jgi:hypothetical protein
MMAAHRLDPIAFALLLGALPAALAQTPVIPATDNATTGAPPAYVDRVIEGLAPEVVDDPQRAYDSSGWPRFLRLETRLGTQPFDERRDTRLGLGIYGFLETPNHGSLSIDGSYTPEDSSGALTLRQTNLPLGGGWLAHHGLGYIDTPAPDITRLPSRVLVPTSILEGASGEWENPGQGLQFQAATGKPGRLEILPATGFERLPGRRTVVGAQWHLGADRAADPLGLSYKGWSMAVQHENARQVSNFEIPLSPADLVDADATLFVLRHEGERHRIKAQQCAGQPQRLLDRRRDRRRPAPLRRWCVPAGTRHELGPSAHGQRHQRRLPARQLAHPPVVGRNRHRLVALPIGPQRRWLLHHQRRALAPEPGHQPGRRLLAAQLRRRRLEHLRRLALDQHPGHHGPAPRSGRR